MKNIFNQVVIAFSFVNLLVCLRLTYKLTFLFLTFIYNSLKSYFSYLLNTNIL